MEKQMEINDRTTPSSAGHRSHAQIEGQGHLSVFHPFLLLAACKSLEGETLHA